MFLITAFTLGLFGSLHCVGMCGPIALALPFQGMSKGRLLQKMLGYHLGRSLTYASLGLIVGLGGEAIRWAGMQRWFALVAGISLLVIALFSLPVESRINQLPGIRQVIAWVRRMLGRIMGSGEDIQTFRLGMLNGLLPCGLVYLALVGAVSTGQFWQAGAYMFLFGLGTTPLLLVATVGGSMAGIQLRKRFRKWYPALLIALAILFIGRALDFNMPREMSFWEAMQEMPMCH
ncbi:MAG: sulfite exporter TauE/SafE family protein [Saprospiraceae bacterium]|nr:sulfite exporter TauE/SafE family protein [Saprospiraceae bacterium]